MDFEQIALGDFGETKRKVKQTFTDTEFAIYKNIISLLQEMYDAKIADITLNNLETYNTIEIYKKPVIRLIVKNKIHYISVQDQYVTYDARVISVKSELPWIRLKIKNGNDVFNYKDIICAIYESLSLTPFSCCSRYLQCSDELKCVQPDLKLMRQCNYRKKLLKGVVYYGENATI